MDQQVGWSGRKYTIKRFFQNSVDSATKIARKKETPNCCICNREPGILGLEDGRNLCNSCAADMSDRAS
ncbi:hypothetical protein GC096_30440 [Paenibacillus sp. LMG 31461]|uniref:DUF4428 domain-containing protein n=1 Tax=Paenibacillus plantarum TaxID=2654975 RepID=A0ABX1XJ84_9BACL|nr:hypothetical protein [Paenibacillus plantarum]NOU68349.1 hypothetical protein [Paenibacillus plantarum]